MAYVINYDWFRVSVDILEDSEDPHARPKIYTARMAHLDDPDLTGFGRDETDSIVDMLRTVRNEGYLPDDNYAEEDDGPTPFDGYVSLGTSPGGGTGWHVRLSARLRGSFPAERIAYYELARAMAETGEFPAAWMEGEHGPSVRSIDAEVRAFHDEGGDGLLPLPGTRFASGDLVIDIEGGWPYEVIFDYGDLGVYVHAQGDPDVTAVVPPGRLIAEGKPLPGAGSVTLAEAGYTLADVVTVVTGKLGGPEGSVTGVITSEPGAGTIVVRMYTASRLWDDYPVQAADIKEIRTRNAEGKPLS